MGFEFIEVIVESEEPYHELLDLDPELNVNYDSCH